MVAGVARQADADESPPLGAVGEAIGGERRRLELAAVARGLSGRKGEKQLHRRAGVRGKIKRKKTYDATLSMKIDTTRPQAQIIIIIIIIDC